MKMIRFLLTLGVLNSLLAARPASAQTPPTLGIQLYAGVNITGTVGSTYAIQANTDLSNSNGWTCAALVQLPTSNYIWADTSARATAGQRFYRAVLTGTNLTFILPGTFTMGSPTNEALRNTSNPNLNESQHVVTISKGIYMGKYLVTQGDFLAVLGSNPSHFTGSMALPVDSVSWFDASNYCAMRTAQEQAAGLIPPNWAYRLPMESEWEYACRAGTTTAFYLGSALRSQQANFNGTTEYDSSVGNESNPSGVNLQSTTAVGSYAPNGWGLYDMAGNLNEWCQDWAGPYPGGSVTDPQGASSGTERVLRGGEWLSGGSNCRSAVRFGSAPTGGGAGSGFRVVLAQAP